MQHVSFYREGYPRPQFVRQSFFNLNGPWKFAFDDAGVGERKNYPNKIPADALEIRVPFAYQVHASNIGTTEYHKTMWYWKEIEVPSIRADESLYLTFEGSDYHTKVFVNGKFVGEHFGGYTRFHFDIAPALKKGKGLIAIEIEDDKDAARPRGKQSWREEPWGCWYLETSGIWKTVWMEKINHTHLAKIRFTPIKDRFSIEAEYEIEGFKPGLTLSFAISYHGKPITTTAVTLQKPKGVITLDIASDLDGFKRLYWHPDYPNIMEVSMNLTNHGLSLDQVQSYFAYRIFETEKNSFVLNHNPIFLRFVLEQGYLPNSGMTYENEEQMVKELELIKACGFNGLRMHQKLEDERFFYYCDMMGILTTVEMPSAYEYRDSTISTTIKEWGEAIEQYYNHPSVIMWVPVNESWGVPDIVSNPLQQAFASSLYYLTKSYDPYRPVIDNDGWEHTNNTDVISLHNYDSVGFKRFYDNMDAVITNEGFVNYGQSRFTFAKGAEYQGQPIFIDEFGGIAYKKDGDGWGYNGAETTEQGFLERLEKLIDAIVANDCFAGFCYTQITDVYIEQNGLFDENRVPKAPIEKIKAILTKLC